MPLLHRLAALLALLVPLGLPPAGSAQTRVENVATLDYQAGGMAGSVASNRVVTAVDTSKRPTRLDFRLLPHDYVLTGLACDQAAVPLTAYAAPIDEATFAAAPEVDALDISQPAIFVLYADGGNRDPAVREDAFVSVDVGSSHHRIRLIETGVNTGIFAGGVPAQTQATAGEPCYLDLRRGDMLRLSFDEDPFSLASANDILIDPAGILFDSATGQPIDGATVSLVDASGRPATVFGDDGRTRYPSTVVSGASVTDAGGRVYAGMTGRYRFPLVAPGTYYLRVVPPADYTAPSTVPLDRLQALKTRDGKPFVLNDASFGRALVLSTPDPFYADIPLDRDAGTALLVTKSASVRDASPGDTIQYRVRVTNRGTVAARELHLRDTLPTGLRYERGSTRGAAEPVVAADGRSLDLIVPTLAVGASAELQYRVTVAPGAPAGEAVNRVEVLGAANASNVAAASVRIRPLLFTDALTVIGRVSEGDCRNPDRGRRGVAGVRLLLEDGTYTMTDRDGLYHFEGVRAGRHVVQLDTASIPASHESVACDADTRAADSALSRFVEGSGGLLKRVDFQLRPTGRVAAVADPLPIAVVDDATAAGNRDWLAGQAPGVDWLFPATDHNPRAPVLRVAIKHLPNQRIALTVGGTQTEALAFDGTDTGGGVAVSKWTGLPLVEGDNRLVARVLDADGAIVQTLERTVHYAGAATRVAFDASRSRLVADGLTRPLLAVRVTDASGRPVRAGTLVPFAVDPPYIAAIEAELQQGRALAGLERTASTARVVGDDGYAFIALQPTTQAGAVRATVSLAEDRQIRTTELRAWLVAAARDWTVVGFGAGTLGYDVLSRHRAALPRGTDAGPTADGQLALYAKGRIKGSWLLTIAYDSDRRRDRDRGLLGTIDPDRYYTVYGDGSSQGYGAPTAGKLYLRLERRELFALFGDFETGLNDTELGRYRRTLTGVQAAYEGRRVRATEFVAKTDQQFARDEIQGNGLSGPYRLRARDIVPNSDGVRIEVRDRFRSERIVSSKALTRHIDYDIDPAIGTLRFREPVLSRDAALNPVFIVATYEVAGIGARRLAAGGRAAARVGAVEVGATAIRDETRGPATVLAADVRATLSGATELRGEVASGGLGGLGAGGAWLAEVEHHGRRIDGLLYARQQSARFGVGQQNLVEADTRKVGAEGRIALTDALSLTANGWHQQNLAAPGSRIAGDVRLEHVRPTGTLYAGVQVARDRGLDRSRVSRLVTLGGSQALFDGALTLDASTQFAPGGRRDSADFPARHQLTARWRVKDGIRLIGGYEVANGNDFTAGTARVGFDVAPWTGAKLASTLNSQAIGENGARSYAQYGLAQSLTLGRRWTVDATLDATNTLKGAIPTRGILNPLHPVALGGFIGQDGVNGDFVAATLGATYRAARWWWNGRVEYRDADASRRLGLTSNLLRSLGEGKTLAAALRGYGVTDRAGNTARSLAADLAVAWRPLDGDWSLLERLSVRSEATDSGFTAGNVLGVGTSALGAADTTRVVNNLTVTYRSGPEGRGHGVEASVYRGAKYVRGRIAGEAFDGFIDVVGFDLRRDLGRRFDVGVASSVQHAWRAGAWNWSGGPSAGIAPAANPWISAGYNIAGYRDRDFEADRYTRQGPYITMRLKFDQTTLAGLIP